MIANLVMTQEDLNTSGVDVTGTSTVEVPVTSTEKDFKQSEQSKPELTFCNRLGILGLSLLVLWFVILVISIVICVFYTMVGVPTPQTVRGEVINQTSDHLAIRPHVRPLGLSAPHVRTQEYVNISDKELLYVKILTWPSRGMYPTTPVLGFWHFGDYTVITTDSIEGKDVEVYQEDGEDEYVVGKYCEDRTLNGKKLLYFECNEITTSLIYYFFDGYMTWNLNIFIVLMCLLLAVFLIAVAISCTVVPIWAVIGLCSMAFCSDNRICREWCLNMDEASETIPV